MTKKLIKLDELNRLVSYDRETGVFKWKVARSNRVKVNDIIGTKSHGYLTVRLNNRHYRLHRLAWLIVHKEWPDQIDHINRKRDDNRICNLRNVDNLENGKNQPLKSNTTTKINGVCYEKRFDRYKVHIKVDGKAIVLGRRKTLKEAASLRAEADIKYKFHRNHGRSFEEER